VNFEAGQSWWEQLLAAGFDPNKPAVVASTGVTMYLTKETNIATFKQMAKLAPGSTFATTFMLTFELLEEIDKPVQEFTMKMAKQSGTPFISFFSPEEVLTIAKNVGFKTMSCISQPDIRKKYFSDRSDGLCSASAENFLVATT
jgi:O-methyltransferase involved in polyketide biosynthesis